MLTLNGGSSSIRFAIYPCASEKKRLGGKIDRIRTARATLTVDTRKKGSRRPQSISAADHHAAAGFLLDWLEAQPVFASVCAVGHRVVHGFTHSEPQRIAGRLLAELRRNTCFAPDPLPTEIRLIETFARRDATSASVAMASRGREAHA